MNVIVKGGSQWFDAGLPPFTFTYPSSSGLGLLCSSLEGIIKGVLLARALKRTPRHNVSRML